jgi:hypothetical protein
MFVPMIKSPRSWEQFEKANDPIDFNECGNCNVGNFEQFAKAFDAIDSSDDGKLIEDNETELKKANDPIDFNEFGKFRLDNIEQFANAFAPIDSTLSVRIIEVNEGQFEKALSPMFVNRSSTEEKLWQSSNADRFNVCRNSDSMTKEPSKLQLKKAESPIDFTLRPIDKFPRRL